MSHKFLHFGGHCVGGVLDGSIDDTEFALVLEWMVLIVHDIEHAAEHPDIHALIYGVF